MQHNDKPTRLRLVAYVRVSTNGQAIKGDSPAAQEEAIREWAEERGHAIVGVLADNGLSGTLDADDRPALAAALIEIDEGRADGLVFRELDRLARELHVQEAVLGHVWAAGGAVFEVAHGEVLSDDPGDPMRTAMRQMKGVMAQLDAGLIRVRLQRARVRRAQQGHYVGGPWRRKYGFELVQNGGKSDWQPVAEEQAVIARVVAGRADGRTLQSIADELNADGVPPPRAPNRPGGEWSGSCWWPAAIKRILDRKTAEAL